MGAKAEIGRSLGDQVGASLFEGMTQDMVAPGGPRARANREAPQRVDVENTLGQTDIFWFLFVHFRICGLMFRFFCVFPFVCLQPFVCVLVSGMYVFSCVFSCLLLCVFGCRLCLLGCVFLCCVFF